MLLVPIALGIIWAESSIVFWVPISLITLSTLSGVIETTVKIRRQARSRITDQHDGASQA